MQSPGTKVNKLQAYTPVKQLKDILFAPIFIWHSVFSCNLKEKMLNLQVWITLLTRIYCMLIKILEMSIFTLTNSNFLNP